MKDDSRLLSMIAPHVLSLAQELDDYFIPQGILHPAVAKLRIIAAQVAGAARN